MKIRLLLLCIICAGSTLLAQDMGSLAFINDLADKKTATFGDAVKLFVVTLDRNSAGFRQDLNVLKKAGVATGYDIKEKAPLRKGVVARMAARYLKLDDSLWYDLFGTERYAFRACVAAEIMIVDGSEWDTVSGEELIEIMRRVGDRSGGEQ